MSAPVKKCEVCDDTGSKSREIGGNLDCTTCTSADERVSMRDTLGLTWGDDDAWRAYQLGKAAAAPVVPVAAQPVVLRNPYTGVLRDSRDIESDPTGVLIAEPGAPLHAAPSLEAQPAGEVSDTKRLDFMLAKDAFTVLTVRDGTIRQYQLMTQDEDEDFHILSGEHRYFNSPREAIDAAMAQGEK